MDNRSESNSHCPRSTIDFDNPNVEDAWALKDLIILGAQNLSEDVHLCCKDTWKENWGIEAMHIFRWAWYIHRVLNI